MSKPIHVHVCDTASESHSTAAGHYRTASRSYEAGNWENGERSVGRGMLHGEKARKIEERHRL